MRPTLSTVEEAVSSYLETLDMGPDDATVVASVLWVEVIRQVAGLRTPATAALANTCLERLAGLKAKAPFDDVLALEQESRAAIFALTNARYIELIFQINAAFAQKRFAASATFDDAEAHRNFFEPWRKAKALEFQAIADGDPELGVLAARRSRELWQRWTSARNVLNGASPT
jgi:DNA-binding GntR family transcriptional regulator